MKGAWKVSTRSSAIELSADRVFLTRERPGQPIQITNQTAQTLIISHRGITPIGTKPALQIRPAFLQLHKGQTGSFYIVAPRDWDGEAFPESQTTIVATAKDYVAGLGDNSYLVQREVIISSTSP